VLFLQLNARPQPTCVVNNPTGNAFVCEETDLTSVHQAQRLAAPELNRVWRIKNPSRQHPYRYECAVCTPQPIADESSKRISPDYKLTHSPGPSCCASTPQHHVERCASHAQPMAQLQRSVSWSHVTSA
jgi:hypothetical protein